MDPRLNEIRGVLDALASVEDSDNDAKEEVYERELGRIRGLERENIIDIVKRAVGSDKRRRKYSPLVFAELYDVPGIEAAVRDLLRSADRDGRAAIIQTIGLRKMRGFAGVLNDHFAYEADDFCRDCVLFSLAVLSDKRSLPIFEYLMRRADPRDEWRIIVAARHFDTPEFLDYLVRVFNNPQTQKANRVMAAWGLAKQGDRNAAEYLVTMLDDPTVRTENSFDPGESLRAAQALSDIHGWGFEWHQDSVALVKHRLSQAK